MDTDSRSHGIEWGGALLLAALLHAAVVGGYAAGCDPSLGTASPGGSARPEPGTRIRLALGRAGIPVPASVPASVAAPVLAPVPAKRPAPAPQPAAETPARTRGSIAPPVASQTSNEPQSAVTTAAGSIASPLVPTTTAGADAGASAQAGDSGGDGRARDAYFDAVFVQLQENLDYPRRARLEEIEGSVVLQLRIDRNGRLEECAVSESSGSSLLDRHAVRIARRAAPFGPVPAGFEQADLVFELPLDFRLRD